MRFLCKSKCIGVILLVMLFVMTGVTIAQQGQPPSSPHQQGKRTSPLSAGDIVAGMKKELNLSNDQVSQITPIIQNEINQMQNLMKKNQNQEVDRDTVKSQIEALRKDTESQLSQYLTQEQLTQWKNKQQQPPSKERGNRMGPGH